MGGSTSPVPGDSIWENIPGRLRYTIPPPPRFIIPSDRNHLMRIGRRFRVTLLGIAFFFTLLVGIMTLLMAIDPPKKNLEAARQVTVGAWAFIAVLHLSCWTGWFLKRRRDANRYVEGYRTGEIRLVPITERIDKESAGDCFRLQLPGSSKPRILKINKPLKAWVLSEHAAVCIPSGCPGDAFLIPRPLGKRWPSEVVGESDAESRSRT